VQAWLEFEVEEKATDSQDPSGSSNLVVARLGQEQVAHGRLMWRLRYGSGAAPAPAAPDTTDGKVLLVANTVANREPLRWRTNQGEQPFAEQEVVVPPGDTIEVVMPFAAHGSGLTAIDLAVVTGYSEGREDAVARTTQLHYAASQFGQPVEIWEEPAVYVVILVFFVLGSVVTLAVVHWRRPSSKDDP
jgi:hypothetical protein